MKKETRDALIWAAAMLVLALAATTAHKLGYISDDMVRRPVTAVFGLWMVWYGNRIPKRLAPSACALQAQRVSAWSMILSGIVYTGLWVFAPIETALWVGTAVVFGGIIVTLAYCLALQSRSKTRQSR